MIAIAALRRACAPRTRRGEHAGGSAIKRAGRAHRVGQDDRVLTPTPRADCSSPTRSRSRCVISRAIVDRHLDGAIASRSARARRGRHGQLAELICARARRRERRGAHLGLPLVGA
jgi:hypothetical protein